MHSTLGQLAYTINELNIKKKNLNLRRTYTYMYPLILTYCITYNNSYPENSNHVYWHGFYFKLYTRCTINILWKAGSTYNSTIYVIPSCRFKNDTIEHYRSELPNKVNYKYIL